ncbi:MAG: 16S rRNA (cytidine(1402)-2'-O)-methyltransferase [Clostridia bacterium]
MSKLYVVGTPIGNLSDFSPRAVETLRLCACIAAEDTRVTSKLLHRFEIDTPLTSCHQHNEQEKAQLLINRMLAEDISVALVTDAGMPAISDPGYLVVQEAVAAGIEVLSVPGPSAMAAALSISGFDTREFAFYGFLPREKGALREKLLEIARGVPIAVLHESPHRVTDLLEAVAETLAGCQTCVCCDLTKLHEYTLHGAAEEVLTALRNNPKTEKGEYCVVLDFSRVHLPEKIEAPVLSPETMLLSALLDGKNLQDAMQNLARSGYKRNTLYRASVRVRTFLMQWSSDEKGAEEE